MMTPATASTGTTALMPISGASVAARNTPGPKPPTPLMTDAPSATAATSASVGASSSNLVFWHAARPAGAVDRHVSERRLGDLHHHRRVGRALGEDLDLDRDRSVADFHQVDVEGNQVADL